VSTFAARGEITLSVNGSEMRVPANLTAAGLIEHMALTGKRVALERNGEILPKSRFPEQTLEHGDQLEIVVAVGGG